MNAGAPVLIAVDRLCVLTIDIADIGDRTVLFENSADVLDSQTRRAAVTGAHTIHARGARQDHQQIGAEALNLGFNRGARALANRDHRDQRGDPDEHAEHRQSRAQFVSANGPERCEQCYPAD